MQQQLHHPHHPMESTGSGFLESSRRNFGIMLGCLAETEPSLSQESLTKMAVPTCPGRSDIRAMTCHELMESCWRGSRKAPLFCCRRSNVELHYHTKLPPFCDPCEVLGLGTLSEQEKARGRGALGLQGLMPKTSRPQAPKSLRLSASAAPNFLDPGFMIKLLYKTRLSFFFRGSPDMRKIRRPGALSSKAPQP